MIIKRKYSKIIEKPQPLEQTPEVIQELQSEIIEDTNISEDNIEEIIEEEQQPQEEFYDELNLDNITFQPREERREGSRRRGYRRIIDRNIISRAQEEAITIKELSVKEGKQEGLELARDEIQKLNTALEEFFLYKNKVYDEISNCILDISLEIAKKIIKKEIETDKSVLIEMIKSAVENVNHSENKIVLKVAPDDVSIVKDKIPEIFSSGEFEAKITVLADKTILSGGVIIETSNGVVDASIETQTDIIEQALKKGQT